MVADKHRGKVHVGLGENNYGKIVKCVAEFSCPNGGLHFSEKFEKLLRSESTLAAVEKEAIEKYDGDFNRAYKQFLIDNAEEVVVPNTINPIRAAYDVNAFTRDGMPVKTTPMFKKISDHMELKDIPRPLRRRGARINVELDKFLQEKEQPEDVKEWIEKNFTFVRAHPWSRDFDQSDVGGPYNAMGLSNSTVAIFTPTPEIKKEYEDRRDARLEKEAAEREERLKVQRFRDLSDQLQRKREPYEVIVARSSDGVGMLREPVVGEFVEYNVRNGKIADASEVVEVFSEIDEIEGKTIHWAKTKLVFSDEIDDNKKEKLDDFVKWQVGKMNISEGDMVSPYEYQEAQLAFESLGNWKRVTKNKGVWGMQEYKMMEFIGDKPVHTQKKKPNQPYSQKVGDKVFYGDYKKNKSEYSKIGKWSYDADSKSMVLDELF